MNGRVHPQSDYERRHKYFRDTVRLHEEVGKSLISAAAAQTAKSLLPDGDYLVRYAIQWDDLTFTSVSQGESIALCQLQWPPR